MSELPSGWTKVKLEKLVSKVEKVDPQKWNRESFQYIDISSIDNQANKIIGSKKYLSLDAPSRARQLIKEGDILFSTVRTYLKNIAQVPNEFNDEVASTGFAVIRTLYPTLSKYLFYYAISSEFLTPLNELQRGISYPAVSNKDVLKQVIPLPPLNEQKRIVEKLDRLFANLDSLKSRLEHIPELLKQFRQSVLTQAVTGKLTEEWREKFNLPEWENIKLDVLIDNIEAGKNFSCPEIPVETGKVGLVKISAVTWGKFDPKETKTVEREEMVNPNYFIKSGDFLISRANTIELVGASIIVGEINHNIMLSDKVWRVNFKEEITKRYVNHFLKSSIGRNEIEQRASGNQNSMRNISQKKFQDIDVPHPPLEEQKEVVKRIESLFAIADNFEERYVKLKGQTDNLPQAILAKAFRGELVPQDPNDEPAEKLLKKIEEQDCKIIKQKQSKNEAQKTLDF